MTLLCNREEVHFRVSLRKKRKTRTMPTACHFIQKIWSAGLMLLHSWN
jgi:hypothetical protein